ncbi:hypothetical protein [Pedobacter rhizosphaerae]|uniref:Uncharacterized protein n=1 Tax=Pedobacter rhizosphaerae TaxID=390241 RepID=A0A1H9LIT8_9SPHI|nr:hypothetical protein [Pedobacter rhizosphaerae]SER11310.1 hypothetical protein SAMN04488023_104165 [Pedobacter rhizosphaerae]
MESEEMSSLQHQQAKTAVISGNLAIKWGIYLYGIYALFLLLECIDFLAYLHTPDPGYHPTYNIVHVAFFIVELIVYVSITLGFIIQLNVSDKKPATVIVTVLLITGIRIFMVYYLYLQSEPEVHFVPYIYKKSNELSGVVRSLLISAQIIWGIICLWVWIIAGKKVNKSKANFQVASK